LLTLYTTPVVYLYIERVQQWRNRRRARRTGPRPVGGPSEIRA
jgi:multidrug efflux pump